MELGGEELRDLRIAAFGYDNRREFAALVGVKPRTVEGWEAKRGHVPPGKVALVRQVLAGRSPSWAAMSNMDLIAVLTERLARYDEMAHKLAKYEKEAHTETDAVDPSRDNIDTKDTPKDSDGARKVPQTGAQVAGSSGAAANPRKRPDDTE